MSQFYGIDIYQYYGDHPPPHFHAFYGEDEAMIGIGSLDVVAGYLPRRAKALAIEWASLHVAELEDNWNRAKQGLPLLDIDPLD